MGECNLGILYSSSLSQVQPALDGELRAEHEQLPVLHPVRAEQAPGQDIYIKPTYIMLYGIMA